MGAVRHAPTGPDRPRALRLGDLLTLKDQTDQTGRLLLEDSAPKRARKEAVRQGVLMKTSRCPYQDTPSRFGGAMNSSAYEALRRDTAEVLDGFAWLRWHYVELDPSRSSTVRCLFDIAYIGITMPFVLFHRADDPVPPYRALPSFVANIYKASRGVFSVAVEMLNAQGPAAPTTAKEIVAFAEREGHLKRRETERVCAAPTRLIERTLAVIMGEEPADAGRSRLGDLLDFPTLWAFERIQDDFAEELSNYRFVLDALMAREETRDPKAVFGCMVDEGGRRRAFGDCTADVIVHADRVQAELNRLLGRDDTLPALAFEDLLRLL